MTAKAYFGQAYRLDQRINSNMQELDKLRELSTSVSSPCFEEKFSGTRNTDPPFVKYVINIIDMERQINVELEKLVALKKEIRGVIDRVSNANEQMVLRYRYIHNFTWEQIGYELNADKSTVRRWHSMALAHVKLPINPIIL